MANNTITKTTTKSTNEAPWFISSNTQIFTPTDISTVIQPYQNFLQNTTGYQSTTYTSISDVVDVTTITYDTAANAANAFPQLFGPTKNQIVTNRNNLMTLKVQEYNANNPSINVSFSSTVIN